MLEYIITLIWKESQSGLKSLCAYVTESLETFCSLLMKHEENGAAYILLEVLASLCMLYIKSSLIRFLEVKRLKEGKHTWLFL